VQGKVVVTEQSVDRDEPSGSDAETPSPDVRLAESSDGWLLTVTPDAIAALLASRDGASAVHAEVMVEVHPNLVPGEPFLADVRVAELTPERTDRTNR
jgi:hypothetical protein